MRIEGSPYVVELSRPQAVRRESAETGTVPEAAQAGRLSSVDRVAISPKARELQRLKQDLAELPEVKKENVKVEVLDGTLTIEGERTQEKEEKGKKFHKIEREYGKFMRQFTLPPEVATDKMEAEFKDGVLNVHLPKTAVAKPKAIEVKVA